MVTGEALPCMVCIPHTWSRTHCSRHVSSGMIMIHGRLFMRSAFFLMKTQCVKKVYYIMMYVLFCVTTW